jgi:PAS domain S-box-containing protein
MHFNDHWKSVINTLRDGLIIVDTSGTILALNTSVERITGYSADDLIGRSCRILDCTGCEIYDSGTNSAYCSLFKIGDVRDKKCLISKKNHRNITIIKCATVLRDENGEVIGAVETLTDISDEVQKENDIRALRKTCQLDQGFHGILGESAPMQRLFELIENVSQTKTPVMIHGQSGTGKELVARAIHESSPREFKPYIQVNCSALNDNLLESELFGHVKGAFTGADQLRIGRFEAADEGTIFLDEIGDLSIFTQTKLLRVIEENQIERVGDHQPIPVNVRIITATNKDLETLVEDGRFRQDLYFRINVFPIYCPSLAERAVDIPLIVSEFIDRGNAKFKKNIQGLTPPAMEKLMTYQWPGNVREIRNAIEYAFVLCQDDLIHRNHLPQNITMGRTKQSPASNKASQRDRVFQDTLMALKEADGNQSKTAKILGVSRVTIWKRIKKYGIDLKQLGDTKK